MALMAYSHEMPDCCLELEAVAMLPVRFRIAQVVMIQAS